MFLSFLRPSGSKRHCRARQKLMQAWLCTHLSAKLVVLSKICLGGVSGNRRTFAADL